MNHLIRLFPRAAACSLFLLIATFFRATYANTRTRVCFPHRRGRWCKLHYTTWSRRAADSVARLCGDFADVDADSAAAREKFYGDAPTCRASGLSIPADGWT